MRKKSLFVFVSISILVGCIFYPKNGHFCETAPSQLSCPGHTGDMTGTTHVHDFLYIAAAEAFSMSTQPQDRRTNLTWEASSGGLDDSARELLRNTYFNLKAVFEFGIGESTRIATAVGIDRYSGVDSDVLYIKESRERAGMHYKFYLADIGQVETWGFPEQELPKQVMQYQFAPLLSELEGFDAYFVDGRWRVACACVSFLRASKYEKREAVVLFHDYERKEYHAIESISSVTGISKGGRKLAILQRRSDVSDEVIFALWRRHAFKTT